MSESESQIRTAILTVSDTASADARADKSGPTIKEILEERGFVVKTHLILPDDEAQIQAAVYNWSAKGDVDWIITTGGTGFGVRDRTPEAISPLIERDAPGLVHLLLSTSLKHTPLAALSRPVAGTIKNTLVVTLPGSAKAVRESLEALLSGGVVEHAVDLIRGGSGKSVHAALASSASTLPVEDRGSSEHHHHHHHHHPSHSVPQPKTVLSTDPSLPASARHRKSPYPLISFEQAIESILKEVTLLKPIKLPVTPALKGHVLAEDVYAGQNVPPSQTTSVDGYALRSTDPPGIYKVLTSETHLLHSILPSGSVYRINTGGSLPTGADTVIMVEDTYLSATVKDSEGRDIEEKEVETLVQMPTGENVRAPGSDVKQGDLALKRGQIIHSAGGEIGTLAFVGRKEVEVYKKPVVALLSTGNEIVDLHSQPTGQEGRIWDTNRPSLQAALEGMGYEVTDLGIVPDDLAAHVSAIENGLQRADILLTTGGTSMGATDLLKPVIERHFGGSIHFGRVTVKPGKPTTFAAIPLQGSSKPVFALPGNPASALVTFHLFVVPALRKLGGWPTKQCQLPRIQVQVQNAMSLNDRTEFYRVTIRAGDDGFKAYSTGGQRSSRVASMSGANGLVVLPQRSAHGPEKIEVGERAEAIVIAEIQM